MEYDDDLYGQVNQVAMRDEMVRRNVTGLVARLCLDVRHRRIKTEIGIFANLAVRLIAALSSPSTGRNAVSRKARQNEGEH